ncbi:MAG TPA: hypothetical protein VIV10_08950, partial [Gemmatimonadales bacterium]
MTLFFLGLAAILAAGVSAAALHRRPAVAGRAFALLVSAGCVVAVVPAVRVLAGAGPLWARFGPWDFGVDLLSAAFLLVVLGPGLASAWYGHRALGDERDRPVGGARTLFALELAALALVVTARGVVPFLVAWEVMAVLAYFLVIFEHERAEVRRAGLVYLVAT